MQGASSKITIVVIALLTLSACSKGDAPSLMNLRSDGAGPDEFLILPTKPLEAPEDFTALPQPTPGGANRTDATPIADAVNALGGDGARAESSGLRSTEQAIVSAASRYGVMANIRAVLASDDLEWRRANNSRLLERMFNVSTYFRAYEAMSLDQYLELARLRGLGVWTPAAPPDGSN